MTEREKVFVGVDVGAARTKAAVLSREGELLGFAVERSGIEFNAVSAQCIADALAMARRTHGHVEKVASTGYGRDNVEMSSEARTEISCHGKACHHLFKQALTVIDIGGQDNKIIKLDRQGLRTGFKMNRKCAAGTGAFLEEMALRLNIPLERMNALAEVSEETVEFGSFCTVFTATEVLDKIRYGVRVEDVVKGLYRAVIKRVLEMDSLGDTVVMTGGVVAHNRVVLRLMEEMSGKAIAAPPQPQLTGAIGAALYAIESTER